MSPRHHKRKPPSAKLFPERPSNWKFSSAAAADKSARCHGRHWRDWLRIGMKISPADASQKQIKEKNLQKGA
jgi:hypothetical protein